MIRWKNTPIGLGVYFETVWLATARREDKDKNHELVNI